MLRSNRKPAQLSEMSIGLRANSLEKITWPKWQKSVQKLRELHCAITSIIAAEVVGPKKRHKND